MNLLESPKFQVSEMNKEFHFGHLLSWHVKRGLTIPAPYEVPYLGWMASYEGNPVAMAFVRLVEGKEYCVMDNLITNPDMPGEIRSQAVDLVTQSCIDYAKKNKFPSIVAWTKDKNTLERGLSKFGFVVPEGSLVVKDLRG